MATLEQVLSDLPEEEYLYDDIQFLIDEDLRTVTIPPDGVVLGVNGDKDVNRVNFQMPRYYNGFDMSLFKYRVNYKNANGDLNFYDVKDVTIKDDIIYFTWLVDRNAAAYIGEVYFVVRLYKTDGTKVTQNFYTSLNNAKVLEGLQVDENLENPEDVILHLQRVLEEYAYEIAEPILQSWLVDHDLVPGANAEQISKFKELEEKVESTDTTLDEKIGINSSRIDEILKKATDSGKYDLPKCIMNGSFVGSITPTSGRAGTFNPFSSNGSAGDGGSSVSDASFLSIDSTNGSIKFLKKGLYIIDLSITATASTDYEPKIVIDLVNVLEKYLQGQVVYASTAVSENHLRFIISIDVEDFILKFSYHDHLACTNNDINFTNTKTAIYALDWEGKIPNLSPDITDEIKDARVLSPDKTFDSLGSHIRDKISKSEKGAITPDMTSFFEYRSQNLLDKSKVSKGYLNENGSLVGFNSGVYNTTDYIKIFPNKSYNYNTNQTISSFYKVAFYTKNYSFISLEDCPENKIIITPTNARYMRVTVSGAFPDTAQIEYDITAHVYSESSDKTIIEGIPFKNIPNIDAEIDSIRYLIGTVSDVYASDHISFGRKEGTTVGLESIAAGNSVEASGDQSHAEGVGTTASGIASHAEGVSTIASGNYSHAEGAAAKSIGDQSHAEGISTEAQGIGSHTEGSSTIASAEFAHAEGNSTTASGADSHAEGWHTTASGTASHAEGERTLASGDHSHTEGVYTKAGYRGQTVMGIYNDNKEANLFEVGNGNSESNRNNALEVAKDGTVTAAKDFKIGNKSLSNDYYDKTEIDEKIGLVEESLNNLINGDE